MSSPYIETAGSVREPLRRFLQESGIERVAVLCDRNVLAQTLMLTRGMRGTLGVFAFQLGERRKTLQTVEQILDTLVQCGADRQTAIVGVGGGVAGDIFGFAASIFMRGVRYIHVATTLLSMVDAAIGGKTGVDLRGGKNLAGTFSDPVAVFGWVDALQTLPYRHVREGLAETVKHGIIAGGELFDSLETLAPHALWRWPWESLVQRSQQVKIEIVARDRREHGVREKLNLGHTFGHAVETASGYRVSHGAGVSIGLRAAGLLALRTGRFSREEHLRVLTLLTLLGMPGVMYLEAAHVRAAMNADKKRSAGRLRFVMPRAIGDVEYGVPVPDRPIMDVLETVRIAPGDREFR